MVLFYGGKGYYKKIIEWKEQGYKIILYYFELPSVEFAMARVKLRVSKGGHDVPEKDIRRRFVRSWDNFNLLYKPLLDSWAVFDTSGDTPVLLDQSE